MAEFVAEEKKKATAQMALKYAKKAHKYMRTAFNHSIELHDFLFDIICRR